MAKTAIIYTRFSPRRNAGESESCEVQQAYCEQLAGTKNIPVRAVVHDPDISGADEYREKLWHAISLLNKGDVLLVFKRDRLARNVYLSEQINRAVESRGATIEAVSGDVAGNGPEVTMIRQVLASIAEYERKLIGIRTRYSMRQHQRNGRRMSRFCPYGWEPDPADPARMQPAAAELGAIEYMKTLKAEGKGVREITKIMNDEMPDRARTGTWSAKTVMKILARE
jgi:DNA invertase Pin-like site-specific DNA recombinase